MNKSLRTHSEKGIETTLQATGGLHTRFDEMINLLENILNERLVAELGIKTIRTDITDIEKQIQEMRISVTKLQAYSSIRARFLPTAHALAVWKSNMASDPHLVGARDDFENVDPEGNV